MEDAQDGGEDRIVLFATTFASRPKVVDHLLCFCTRNPSLPILTLALIISCPPRPLHLFTIRSHSCLRDGSVGEILLGGI